MKTEINKLKLHRLNFFTDAVLAIILTLLVLELHIPKLSDPNSDMEMLEKFIEMFPQFGSFLLCFLIMANAFLGLSTFYSSVIKYDSTLAVNLVMLLLPLSLMPFASMLIGEYFFNPMSFMFLGFISLFGSVFQTSAANHVVKNNMMAPEVDTPAFRKMMKTIWIFPVITILLLATAYLSTLLAFCLFLGMQIIGIVSVRKFNKMIKQD